jgi:hypothetical protein
VSRWHVLAANAADPDNPTAASDLEKFRDDLASRRTSPWLHVEGEECPGARYVTGGSGRRETRTLVRTVAARLPYRACAGACEVRYLQHAGGLLILPA